MINQSQLDRRLGKNSSQFGGLLLCFCGPKRCLWSGLHHLCSLKT